MGRPLSYLVLYGNSPNTVLGSWLLRSRLAQVDPTMDTASCLLRARGHRLVLGNGHLWIHDARCELRLCFARTSEALDGCRKKSERVI